MVKILTTSAKNTLLQPKHKGRVSLDTILSVHSPMQDLLGKELHFLRNFSLPKKGKTKAT